MNQFKIFEREKYVDWVRLFIQIPIQYEVANVLEVVVWELIRHSIPLLGGGISSVHGYVTPSGDPLIDPFLMNSRVEKEYQSAALLHPSALFILFLHPRHFLPSSKPPQIPQITFEYLPRAKAYRCLAVLTLQESTYLTSSDVKFSRDEIQLWQICWLFISAGSVELFIDKYANLNIQIQDAANSGSLPLVSVVWRAKKRMLADQWGSCGRRP